MVDLGSQDNKYTWTNVRHEYAFIQEQLDRAIANLDCRLNYPNAKITHLLRIASGHSPSSCLELALTLNGFNGFANVLL